MEKIFQSAFPEELLIRNNYNLICKSSEITIKVKHWYCPHFGIRVCFNHLVRDEGDKSNSLNHKDIFMSTHIGTDSFAEIKDFDLLGQEYHDKFFYDQHVKTLTCQYRGLITHKLDKTCDIQLIRSSLFIRPSIRQPLVISLTRVNKKLAFLSMRNLNTTVVYKHFSASVNDVSFTLFMNSLVSINAVVDFQEGINLRNKKRDIANANEDILAIISKASGIARIGEASLIRKNYAIESEDDLSATDFSQKTLQLF